MKKLLIIALVFFASSAFAQKDTVGLNVPFVNGQVTYQRVYDAGTLSQNLLFSNAHVWFLEHTTVKLIDSSLYRVVGTTSAPMAFDGIFGISKSCTDYFTVQVDCKDGKYRIQLGNITLHYLDAANNAHDLNADDMIVALTGGVNNTRFNNSQLKRALVALNAVMDKTFGFVSQAVGDKDEF